MKKLLLPIFILSLLMSGCISQQLEEQAMFRPVKEVALDGAYTFERHFIPSTDTTDLEAWWLQMKNPKANIIYFSGNGSNIRSAVPFFNELAKEMQVNVFSFNYSGYGRSGGEPSIERIVRDAYLALDYYEQLNTVDLPTYLVGYSLGGFVGLNHIRNKAIDKAVFLATFSSSKEVEEHLIKTNLPGIVRPFLNISLDEEIYAMDNRALAQKANKPILYVHGEKDDFIPAWMSKELYEVTASPGKKMEIIPEGDHRSVLKNPEHAEMVVKAIQRFISEPGFKERAISANN